MRHIPPLALTVVAVTLLVLGATGTVRTAVKGGNGRVKHVPDPNIASVVRQAFELFSNGKPLAQDPGRRNADKALKDEMRRRSEHEA